MSAELRHIPSDYLVPFQWHADEIWIDEYTKQPTSYLVGFPRRKAAVEYGRRRGWISETEPDHNGQIEEG